MTASRPLRPVLGLFLLAPFTGEFLLGNLTVADIGLGVVLAPLYGCGALLVRELGRRGGGWPAMFLLAAAYALIEEGPVDQLLWNRSYAGADNLSGDSYLPALGMSVELTQTVLALHTVWSVCVPIAIVETLAAGRRTTPWLGRNGLTVIAALYALGAGLVFWGNYAEERFLASPAQLAGAGVVIATLVAAAFLVRSRPPAPDAAAPGTKEAAGAARTAPSPWWAGAAALAATSAYWGPLVLVAADWYEWIGVAVWFAVAGLGGALVTRWSRRPGWNQRHRFALAAGATLTYVWTAFPLRPESGGPPALDLAGNIVCGAVAITVLSLAARAVARDHGPASAPAHW